jgi:16S rRNA (guanine1516-N2)-methyltransferase
VKPSTPNSRSIEIDYLTPAALRKLKQFARKKELLQKACGVKAGQPLSVFDATPGYGYDSLALGLTGAQVVMCERCPEVALALQQALLKAGTEGPPWLRESVSRITLLNGDSIEYLQTLEGEQRPEVIVVDPMFPEERRSALSKKEIQILRALCGDDPDSPKLLEVALRAATKRVVVKRRIKDPALGQMKPDYSLQGTSIRVDIYHPSANTLARVTGT